MQVTVSRQGESEAVCTATYFLHSRSNFNPTGEVATIDIGGGTTDITFFENRVLKAQDSVKFAGNDVVDVAQGLLEFVRRAAQSNGYGADDNQIEQLRYDQLMRMWPFVKDDWGGKIGTFRNRQEARHFYRTLGLFYSAICYYLGMHLRRRGVTVPLSQLAFAGNGIRFLHIVTAGNVLDEGTLEGWVQLFRSMLAAGHRVSDQGYNTVFFFSPEPKLEVAKGLVHAAPGETPAGQELAAEKMLGLTLFGKAKNIPAESWPEMPAVELTQYTIQFKELHDFNAAYNAGVRRYLKNWRLETRPSIDESAIRDQIHNKLHLRGQQELATPLFLEAVRSWMVAQ